MIIDGINYLGVLVAAVAGFAFGAAWYGLLGKQWMAAANITDPPKAAFGTFLIAFIAQLVMAWMLAGVAFHMGEVSVRRVAVSAAFIWVGFVITTMIVNHRFQSQRWSLTLIDGAHWLGVLLVMAIVLGLFGN